MTAFAWPAGIPIAAASWWQVDGTRRFRSPLSGTLRTEQLHPPYWEGNLTFTNLPADQGQAIEAYLWRLEGAVHRALVPMTDYQRQGAGGGSPQVSGAGQTGVSLVTSGWPASTLVLKAGDRIGVSGQVFAIAADATSSGTGTATLSLSNPIRTSPSGAIETTMPVIRCVIKNVFGMNTGPGRFKSGQIEFEEAMP